MTPPPRRSAHASPPGGERGSGAAEFAPLGPRLLSGALAWAERDAERPSREALIRAIAAPQRGRISRRQLHAAGLDRHAIARRVRSGALLARPGGVFALSHLADVEAGAEAEALLAVPGSALSGPTAIEWWRMLPPQAADRPIHVLAPMSAAHRIPGVRVHRSRRFEPRDRRLFHGLPVVSPAWALLDLAAAAPQRELERALDQGLVAGTVRTGELVTLLNRMPRRPGAARMRALLETSRHTTFTRSEAEERLLELIRRARLPEPEVNARICGYEVDFLWRTQRLVVEVDGFRYHSTRRAFEHDHRKDAQLRAAKLEVRRVTFDQVAREPFAVVADIAGGLRV